MREPRWLKLTKYDVKGNADTDRCKSGAQPTSESALRRLYSAILGQIGAEFGPLRALVDAFAFWWVILCHAGRLTASHCKAIA